MTDEDQQASRTWRVTPDMMCILDREGLFVAVNPAWTATMGWGRAEMVGKLYLEFLHPDDLARSISAFEVVKRGEPILRFENRYRTRTEDYRWLQWVAVPESDQFYCTARDVTDDKERVDRIAEQQSEAELREQFIAVLGHDLRNPLAGIGAGVRLLQRKVQDENSVEILRQMQSSTARMSELIDNLMDFARVRLGDGIRLERTLTTNFATSFEQVIEEVRLASPRLVIAGTTHIEGPVTCDVPRIAQLVSNLVANAAMHGKPSEPVFVHAEAREGRLKITVRNKGEPIPEAAKERLFQPFFRGAVRPSKQGLGLGLYIASEITKAHDGMLSVSSTDDETCFTLNIPA
jgi:phosphoserine phosphatase RsbU/P